MNDCAGPFRNSPAQFVFIFDSYLTVLRRKPVTLLSKCRSTHFFSFKLIFLCLLLGAGVVSAYAQYDPYRRSDRDSRSDRNDFREGLNAGGNWQEFDTEDPMTGVRRVRFELSSDNTLRESRFVQSRIEIYCEKGKFKSSEFTPGVFLGPPTHPGFWGQPKMEVRVRVDNSHSNKGWDWNGRSLVMDKNTTREALGAQLFRIEFFAREGSQIAEFSPAGLELGRVSHACALTPKKP